MQKLIQTSLDFLISPDQKKYRLANWLLMVILFLGGIYLLGHFLAWGSASVEFPDWGDYPYLSYVYWGAAGSLAALIFLPAMALREKRALRAPGKGRDA